jgi:hypothetical protein
VRLGGNPVCFAGPVAGLHLPHLTDRLSYKDLAGRDEIWKAFGSDSEWVRLRE